MKKIRFSSLLMLLTILMFASCSREALQVQSWNRLETSQASTVVQSIDPANGIEVSEVVKPVEASASEIVEKVAATATEGNIPVATVKPEGKLDPIKEKISKLAAPKAEKVALVIQRKVERQLTKRMPSTVSKSEPATKDISLEGDLRTAVILLIVGIILCAIGGFLPKAVGWIFVLVGSIFAVIGLIFLLLWLLDQI